MGMSAQGRKAGSGVGGISSRRSFCQGSVFSLFPGRWGGLKGSHKEPLIFWRGTNPIPSICGIWEAAVETGTASGVLTLLTGVESGARTFLGKGL